MRNTSDRAPLRRLFPLPWFASVRVHSVKMAADRAFYESRALPEGSSVRQLDRQSSSQFYERPALSCNMFGIERLQARLGRGIRVFHQTQ